MAEQHVRAVQEYSKIEDDLTRHVLEIIALDIGKDDSPAYTSFRKIANRARCALNTAQLKIQDAIDSGELIARKDGKYWFYSINPELIPYGRTAMPENSGKNQTNRIATVDDIETLYQRLYQSNEQLYQTLYQKIVSVVSTHQTGTDTEENKEDYEEERIKELTTHFTSASGCFPSAGTFVDEWEPVLLEWRNKYGEKTESMIDAAMSFARGKNDQRRRYTITSPRSLAAIMANLEPANQSNGAISVGAR